MNSYYHAVITSKKHGGGSLIIWTITNERTLRDPHAGWFQEW
jgi:hypothetical protein